MTFEDKFMEIQAEMISLGLEYVLGQADKIYIYGILDSMYSFNIFYRVNNHVIHKHEVNEYFLENENKVDTNLGSVLLKEGLKSIKKLKEFCDDNNYEHPTELWLIYDVKTNSLEGKYSYEGRYEKDENLELIPRLEFEKWFEEVKEKNL